MNFFGNKRRIYLDYASITPMDRGILNEYQKVLTAHWANPSSLYKEGVEAHKVLEEARGRVAKTLEVLKDEVLFTSGGTEANNLAIKGVVESALNSGHEYFLKSIAKNPEKKPHIVSSTIEHPSVRELLMHLQSQGVCEVTFVPVTSEGLIDMKAFKESLREETVLVTIMYVNNEIGTIQPLREIAKAVRAHRKQYGRDTVGTYPYLHTDACQAGQYCSLRIPSLSIDMMTLDGSKLYGPRSVGVLYKRREIKLESEMKGGSQEADLRPGTEHTAGAYAFSLALAMCQEKRETESIRIAKLRDQMLMKILEKIPEAKINGNMLERVPNNINICIPGMDAEYAVFRLDAKGICVSSVTSCRNKSEDSSSYVIEALNKKDCSKSSLRITLGMNTTEREMKQATDIIIKVLSDTKCR